VTRHQKRITVPKSWPIARKTEPWVPKVSPGPHTAADSMPLLIVLRDILKLADNAREAKRILYEGKVLVDGRVQKDFKLPVGIFDIISVPLLNQHFRVLKDSRGMFYMSPVEASDARKLVRIENKTIITGKKQQINLNDGSNKLVDGEFKPGDSLVLSLPERNIEERIEFKEGNMAMIVGGKHTGQTGRLKTIHVVRSSQPNRVTITSDNGDFETIVDYVYMIGKEQPAIKLGAAR
jgi:small subunit ribosomal protein S4e